MRRPNGKTVLMTAILAERRQIARDGQAILDYPHLDEQCRKQYEASLQNLHEATELVAKRILQELGRC
jgi:hypothetical protein